MEIKSISRLKFRHHDEVFTGVTLEDARALAVNYVTTEMWYNNPNEECNGSDPLGHSLYGEPTIVKYSLEGDENNAHVILAIGAKTNDTNRPENNKFCFIDIDKTEQEIADLAEEIEKAIKSLTLVVFDTDTLDLHTEKTEIGTLLSGDVKTAKFHVFDDETKYNNLMVASSDESTGPEGLFIYVNLEYDEEAESFTFIVTNADGTLKKQEVKLPNNYLVGGMYSVQDQSLHLKMKNGDDVVVDCTKLIMEWDVEGESSKTPIVLTREEVGPGYDGDEYHHLQPWQDVLRADIRIGGNVDNNILEKSLDGRYLYVDGVATKIRYYYGGSATTVADTLNELKDIKISPDHTNIIQNRSDGFFANTQLDFISSENQLIFKTTNWSGGTTQKTIQLNTVDIPITDIYYNPATEELIIKWKNDKGEIKTIKIDISQMIDEWEVLNPGHNVTLQKVHKTSGKDQLSADVNIYDGENNILVDRDHSLYVKGTADNIKYNNTTVEGALNDLGQKIDQEIADRIADVDAEETRAKNAEQALDTKIDQEISDRIADVDAEETRATEAEQALDAKIDQEIADRIADVDAEETRAKGAEADLQAEIESVSGDSRASLKHVVNLPENNSIVVVERDGRDGKEAVVNVNLSEQDHNGIRLNRDGLYTYVDIEYDPSGNTLTLWRSDKNVTDALVPHTVQLKNDISIIDHIEYDKENEEIVIWYRNSAGELKNFRIPVSDIIEEWDVKDTFTVELKKERNVEQHKDILTAEVKICSAHTDNILVVHRNEGLYVSGSQIEENKNNIAKISGDVINEIARAEGAEQALNDKIDQEIADRIADVDAEETRAKVAEQALDTKIDQEISDRIADVDAEETRAKVAEADLQTEIETVSADSLNSIKNIVCEDGSLYVDGHDKSNVTISVRIDPHHDDNILVNHENDGLYAPANNDVTRALSGAINDERDRAMSAEAALDDRLEREIARATSAEASLSGAITDERDRAMSAENALGDRIDQEIADRIADVDAEEARAKAAESALTNAISDEAQTRFDKDVELGERIDDVTLTFNETSSVKFSSSPAATGSIITADVKLRSDIDDNIIKCNNFNGLYAQVGLEYDPATNKIRLKTSGGYGPEIQLLGTTIIDRIYFDEDSKLLYIDYTDPAGVSHTLSFPVADLFNDWVIDDNSCVGVKLEKVNGAGGQADKLSGKVNVSSNPDNALQIIDNALFVSKSDSEEAIEIAKCTKNELKSFEKAVIGNIITEECGSGYTYGPNPYATYISGATSFADADFKLDQAIKGAKDDISTLSGKTECVDSKANKIYELLNGVGTSMPDCGSGTTYTPDLGSCVISAATSFMEADRMLGDQICEILEMWQSGMTCTSISNWIDDGANKRLEVDVRPSYGNSIAMTNEDLYISNLTGKTIEHGVHEFTDTNALRIVCLTEGGGVIPDIKSGQNGIYLSNVWNCGKYYQQSTEAAEMAEVSNDGYNVNYFTDEDSSSANYDYNNNVRQ